MSLPTGPRALRATIALALVTILSFLGALSAFSQWQLLRGAQQGIAIPIAVAAANDSRHATLVLAMVLVMLVCVVLVFNWLYNSVRNVHETLGVAMNPTPGWAVGWWFVPLANIVKPYSIMKELLAQSLRGAKSASIVSPSVGLWWGCYLLGGVLESSGERLTDVDMLTLSALMEAISKLLLTVAGIQVIRLIGAIDAAQGAWPEDHLGPVPAA